MPVSTAEQIPAHSSSIFLDNISTPKLTGNEKKIYYALDSFQRATKAYELLDFLRPDGVNAIPTVYRALNGLMKKGLVRYITTTQTYITLSEVCVEEDEERLFLICSNCWDVSAIEALEIVGALKSNTDKINFAIRTKNMEITGLCSKCKGKEL
jgi:Fur family zinc uptake transcriptional regulator